MLWSPAEATSAMKKSMSVLLLDSRVIKEIFLRDGLVHSTIAAPSGSSSEGTGTARLSSGVNLLSHSSNSSDNFRKHPDWS